MFLVLLVIALIIRRKRKAQYDVTGKSLSDALKSLAVKSFDEEKSSEIVFSNPTYMECGNHNNKLDQKAD